MKIIFETDPNTKLKFSDVEIDQFFVYVGMLCQKIHNTSFSIITDFEGSPCADTDNAYADMEIDRILPKVKKIEF